MGMAISLSPGLAPILGSYIAHNHGWRMCFGVISMAAVFIMAMLFLVMPETLAREKRTSFSTKGIVLAYGKALKNTRFIGAALVPSFMIGSLWAWMASTPVLYINYLDIPLQEYGYYGFFAIMMYVIGTLMNSRLVNYFSLKSLLLAGIWMCLSSSLLLVGAGLVEINNAMVLQGLFAPFAIGLSLILPNGTTLAFAQVMEGQGTCSALLGSLEMGMGALSIGLVGTVFDGTVTSIAMLMLGTALVGLVLCYQVNAESAEGASEIGH